MTELEGAILGVLREGRDVTPYAVRRQFQQSLSAEWSGSAGSIYPAIRRLEREGLITAVVQKKDGRGTKIYSLTKKGTITHDDWLCDVARAAGPGMDPFRTRASMWAFLPAARRRTLMKELHQEILTRRQRSLRDLEPDDPVARELLLLQLAMRLQWLKKQE
jgi:DNA-binding PadR family transcriptional regulator